MILRQWLSADADAASHLHTLCFPDPWPAHAFLTLQQTGAFGFIATTEDGAPIGLILARIAADEAEILTFAVAPAARQQGIGTRLAVQALAAAEAAGAAAMFLEVAETNNAARQLYEGLGFAIVGGRAAYYQHEDGAIGALIMRKDLRPA